MQGKGILRKAIDDFFDTSPIGQWVGNVWTHVIEMLEKAVLGEYYDLFVRISTDPTIGKYFDPKRFSTVPGIHQGAIGLLGGFAVNMGMGASSSMLAPVFRTMNYAMDNEIKSARIDPVPAIQAAFRNPEWSSWLVTDVANLGYETKRIDALREISRPRIPEAAWITSWLRDEVSRDELTNELKKRGYPEFDIERVMALSKVIPGVQDLISMAVRDAWNEDAVRRFGYDEGFPVEVGQWTAKQGLSSDWALRYWRAHWNLPSPTQGFEMVQRLRPGRVKEPFTQDDLFTLLKVADYPQYFRDKLMQIAYNVVTRVDIRRLFAEGIYSEDDVYQKYLDAGYSPQDAKDLADYTIKNQTDTEEGKKEKRKRLTLSAVITLFKKGQIDEVKAVSKLAELNYYQEDIEFEIAMAKLDMTSTAAIDYRPEYNRDIKSIAEAEYTARFIDKPTAQGLLSSIGMQGDDIEKTLTVAEYKANANRLNDTLNELATGYVNGSMTYQQVIAFMGQLGLSGASQGKLIEDWDGNKKLRVKLLTEAQYRALWNNGAINQGQYEEYMKGLEYSDDSIKWLVSLYKPEEGG